MHDLERLTAALADRYAVIREIGRGGMATVYLAEDLKHHRRVAIKVLNPELAAALGVERFLREIELAAGLAHPHILPIYDSGSAGGFLYYVMPFVEGESLRDRLTRERQLPVDDALRLCREAADGLNHAHAQGIVHRDIKPENILLHGGHAIVGDFGVACVIDRAGDRTLTARGMTIGTPAYMSPEQTTGTGLVDGRSDVYSLGCVLYELLAGQPPFTNPTAESVLRQHVSAPVPDIKTVRPGVPDQVAATLRQALAKTPADRFNPASAFAEALARSGTPATLAMERAPRWRLRSALVALAAVILLAVVTVTIQSARSGARPPASAAHVRTSIAVLPFQNLSAEPGNAAIADGLHDELLTQLTKVGSLSVMGRRSVLPYARTTRTPREIAADLSVGSIVEGTVQVVGNRLRVNVNLLDADSGRELWAEQYNRTVDDAFAIQSDIAEQIVTAVGAVLASAERASIAASPTANAEAYRLYLLGQAYRRRPGEERENLRAMQHVDEQAVALDPGFALAHVGLAYAYGAMGAHYRQPDDAARGFTEAQTALRLAPTLPQAHWAMGLALYWRRAYSQALVELTTAQRGLPGEPELVFGIAAAQRRLGRWTESEATFERAMILDPRNANVINDAANTYQYTRRYADAVRTYDRALIVRPGFNYALLYRAITFVLWRGDLEPLRTLLDGMPFDAQLGGYGPANGFRAPLLLWARQPDALLTLMKRDQRRVLNGYDFLMPTALYAGWAHQMRREAAAAHEAFAAAVAALDGEPNTDDERSHAARGLAYAELGRTADALFEARWLQQSAAYRHDATSPVAENRAMILAQAGEPAAALDEIERLLAIPSLLTVHTLRLDPRWDAIRDQPRFRALLEKYAPPDGR